MKIKLPNHVEVEDGTGRSSGFTLMESLVSMGMVGIMVLSLYAGISSGFFSVRMSRENLRATQIMIEKLEVIRLLTWDQITSSNFIPSTFTVPYYAEHGTVSSQTNFNRSGLVYSGTISIDPPPSGVFPDDYDEDFRVVTVQLSWITDQLRRSRSLTSYVSRHGIQNYKIN